MLSDQELLSRALSFNAGPPVHLNGWIIDPNNMPEDVGYYTVEARANGHSWVISNHSSVLNRDGQWEHESLPSWRTEDFKERTRFASVQEAFAFLEQWRPQELQRAIAQGFKPWKSS